MDTRRRFALLSLVILALLAVAAAPASARAVKTHFTGTEAYIADTDPGYEWVTNGGVYHLRDNTGYGVISTSDPRVGGTNNLVINGNFTFLPPPVYVTGRMWGTFELANDGGAWAGTYTGYRDENGFSWFKYVGRGTGAYAGMQLRMEYERLDPDPGVAATITGYVIEKAP